MSGISDPPIRESNLSEDCCDQSEDDWDHFSSTLPTGSRIFVVQGEEFAIPKALLVRHSAVFAGINQGIESSEPTALDDSAEAFRDFVDHIYDPIESPLQQPNPSLKCVLNILQIANKYCAEKLEKRAESIAQQLTKPSTLRSHLSERLTHIDVFRIGNIVQNPSVAHNGWSLIVEDFHVGKLSARALLDEARRSQHVHFLVSAYCQIMLGGGRSWEKNQELSRDERWRLTYGLARCSEEWDAFVSRISVGDFVIPEYLLLKQKNIEETRDGVSEDGEALGEKSEVELVGPLRFPPSFQGATLNLYDIVGAITMIHAEKGLRNWDIIGRLRNVTNLQPRFGWSWINSWVKLRDCAETTLIITKACLASFFLLDDDMELRVPNVL